MHTIIRFSLALTLALPGCAHAQRGSEVSDSAHARNRCRLAVQVVETGRPEPHQTWAYEYVRNCGSEGASATAQAILAAAPNADRGYWELVTTPAFYVQDRGIVESALRVAQEPAASTIARVYSMKVLIQALSPGTTLSYDDLTRGPGAQRVCFGTGPGSHHQTRVITPLPSGIRERIAGLMTAISRAPEQDPAVRQAATCVAVHARMRS